MLPLIALMIVSAFGSNIFFVLSTTATRDSILNQQISDETKRLQDALTTRVEEATTGAELLSRDPRVINALRTEEVTETSNESLEISARAQPTRNRLGIDQIVVTNAAGEVRTNIAPSFLEAITVRSAELLQPCATNTTRLATFEGYRLLIVCAPVVDLGAIYSILDLDNQVTRTSRQLELASNVSLVDVQPDVIVPPTMQQRFDDANQMLIRDETFVLGNGKLQTSMELSATGISAVVNSGFRTNLIGSGFTLLLLGAAGFLLARSLTLPILKLSSVAQAVAQGDLSQRANLHHEDEIGQLGRAFDQATGQITELLEDQARTASERKVILQSIADGVLAIDTNERILVLNPAAATLLEQPEAEALIGKALTELHVPNDPAMTAGLQQVVQQVRNELTETDPTPIEEQISLGRRIVQLRSAPTIVDGVVTGAVMSIQDVTRAVELDRAKSEFIATASHELRTPLASLRGFVDVFLLTSTDNLNESQHMYLQTIKRQTNSLTQLVNDLLEIARLERGDERLERRWVAPASAIEAVLSGMTGAISQRDVQLSVELHDDLPMIWFDSLHLRMILANLFSNAVKYVYAGGIVIIRAYTIERSDQLPTPPFQLEWERSNEASLLITVEDNGVGIRTEDQPRIFERFFRSENPLSVEVGGTGLGLAITYELVKLHDCQIGFRSSEGNGSLFWLRIPASTIERFTELDEQTYNTPNGADISSPDTMN
ncbi:MAG: HAMP domain-containing protein [Chloroflexaceae bacterium]|nr:HAMP domain-containing protein [Chloroflexaceae bacterium]